jgi:hypothetical protein
MADAICFLWLCCLRSSCEEFIAQSHSPNEALHLTEVPLRSIAAGEL